MSADIERLVMERAYDAFFEKGDSINLKQIQNELGTDEILFWNVIDSMEHRRWIKIWTTGGNYKITAGGIIYAEKNDIVSSELHHKNDSIRIIMLDELTKAYEKSGSIARVSISELAEKAEADDYLVGYNLQVLDDLGYVEPFTTGTYKITHRGLGIVKIWRQRSSLVDEFEHISKMKPQPRGRAVQKLIAKVIEKDGWFQDEGVRTVHEEMDVLVYKDREYYLIECKWEKDPIQASIVRELYGKLENRVGVQGIITSMSGFTEGALKQAQDYANKRVILFFGSDDLHQLIRGDVTFDEFLTEKYQQLVSKRKIVYK